VQERLAAGWRYDAGPKDVDRKTSPYLTEWEQLPEPIREIDRQFVRAIPALLARVGIGIVRHEPSATVSQSTDFETVPPAKSLGSKQ
jgi:hypothetical protein